VNRLKLKVMLVQHEGKRPRLYDDGRGNLTIGVGRNLTACELSDDEIALMLDNDINRVWRDCSTQLAGYGFNALDDDRQHVLLDMTFNLGVAGVLKFQKMLAAIARRDFDAAATEMLNSAWAAQVGDRAQQLAALMRQKETVSP